MRYMIKQKVFSFGAKFNIKNEFDEEIFSVQGEVFSFGKKLWMKDLQENELIYIEQELFNFLPVYNIIVNGETVARVKKRFSLFSKEFDIESKHKDYTLEGNFLSHEYRIISDNMEVARISKEWFTFGDTYGVEISDTEDHPFILAIVIVLDQVCHER